MAGHSKWANIKHRKAKVDAKRGKVWSKVSRALIVAAKNGGADPATNLTLRYAILEARAANMPKDTIERAIKKGAGAGGGENYEEVRYEGYGPAGVAIVVDALTDNRARTAPDLRLAFSKFNGNLGETGCVSFNFEKRGQIFIEKSTIAEDRLMELALEAGADDVSEDDAGWIVATSPASFLGVKEALDAAGVESASAEITMVPLNTVELAPHDAEKTLRLIEALEDNDDVQKVYSNADISDEVMAKIGG